MTGACALMEAAQDNLDRVGAAVVSGDFASFLDHVAVPFVGATARGVLSYATVSALESAFGKIHAAYRALGVSRVDGTVESVFPDGEGRMLRTHVTRLWNGDRLVRAPHSGLSVLCQRGDHWRSMRAQYAVDAPGEAGMGFDACADLASPAQEDEAIFATALGETTAAFLGADFELLRSAVKLPLFLQGADGTRIIKDVDTLRDHFAWRLTEMRMHEITDLVRSVKSVRRLCDVRLQGIYRTHVLSGETLVVPSFMSVVTIGRCEDGVWRTCAVMHPLGSLALSRAVSARS